MVSVDVVERTLLKIPPYLASRALDELLRPFCFGSDMNENMKLFFFSVLFLLKNLPSDLLSAPNEKPRADGTIIGTLDRINRYLLDEIRQPPLPITHSTSLPKFTIIIIITGE